MNVLFVCAGNTCRSPLAEAIARARVSDADVHVASAGWSAEEGRDAEAHAVAVAGEGGLDISSHRARLLTSELVADSDLILALDRTALENVAARGGEAKARTLAARGVADPYGGTVDDYRQAYREIEVAVAALVDGGLA